jgi:hypothetical protein
LIGATDRGYLVELLGRMAKHNAPRALSERLPEWRYLDRATNQWGLRHYDPKDAELDPTSPFGRWNSGCVRDDKAIGLIFSLDRTNRATVTYLTGNREIGPVVAKYWQNEQLEKKPQVRQVDPGLFQVTAPIGSREADNFFLLLLYLAMGYGAAL